MKSEEYFDVDLAWNADRMLWMASWTGGSLVTADFDEIFTELAEQGCEVMSLSAEKIKGTFRSSRSRTPTIAYTAFVKRNKNGIHK